jgi:hypothetical protein
MPLPLLSSVPDLSIWNRRRSIRYTTHYLRIFSPVPGMVLDLGERGLSLLTFSPIEPGQEHHFRIRHRSQVVTLSGRVRWLLEEEDLSPNEEYELQERTMGVEFSEGLNSSVLAFLTGRELPYLPWTSSRSG